MLEEGARCPNLHVIRESVRGWSRELVAPASRTRIGPTRSTARNSESGWCARRTHGGESSARSGRSPVRGLPMTQLGENTTPRSDPEEPLEEQGEAPNVNHLRYRVTVRSHFHSQFPDALV